MNANAIAACDTDSTCNCKGDCRCMPDPTGGVPQYVYAIGRLRHRIPSLGVEREFAQAIGRQDVSGLNDSRAMYEMISKPENRYLARKLCWVMSIEALDTYVLTPRDTWELDVLTSTIRRDQTRGDVDVIVGRRGPIAPIQLCGGLQLPTVTIDQVYSFDTQTLVAKIPTPQGAVEEVFRAAANELLERILQVADNAGATDAHRALNYLVVRYPAIYTLASDAHARNESLSNVEARTSRLTGARNVIDVIFSFTNRASDVTDKFFVRVDVTEVFPFLVSKLSPYYDR